MMFDTAFSAFPIIEGSTFLGLYSGLLALAGIDGLALKAPPGRPQPVTGAEPLAWLAGGRTRLAESVAVRLLARGAIEVEGRRMLRATPGATGVMPIERQILAALPASWTGAERAVDTEAQAIRADMEAADLVLGDAEAAARRWRQTWPWLLLLAIGAARLAVGVARERPVGFLIALMVVAALVAVLRWGGFDRRTMAAHAALAQAKARADRLRRAPTHREVDLAVALFGTAVLAASPWADLHRLRSSDGGSEGGGDSSGDGGCGGGCGGCGS
jgi:uncharacterized protein (TIGR04222 family)